MEDLFSIFRGFWIIPCRQTYTILSKSITPYSNTAGTSGRQIHLDLFHWAAVQNQGDNLRPIILSFNVTFSKVFIIFTVEIAKTNIESCYKFGRWPNSCLSWSWMNYVSFNGFLNHDIYFEGGTPLNNPPIEIHAKFLDDCAHILTPCDNILHVLVACIS